MISTSFAKKESLQTANLASINSLLLTNTGCMKFRYLSFTDQQPKIKKDRKKYADTLEVTAENFSEMKQLNKNNKVTNTSQVLEPKNLTSIWFWDTNKSGRTLKTIEKLKIAKTESALLNEA
jgi:hypothetical protein